MQPKAGARKMLPVVGLDFLVNNNMNWKHSEVMSRIWPRHLALVWFRNYHDFAETPYIRHFLIVVF